MISRRCLIASAGALATAGAFAPDGLHAATAAIPAPRLPFPPLQPLSFRILRKGEQIGTHVISFAGSQAGDLTISINVDLVVRFAFIPVFRYTHVNVEKWSGGQFAAMDARTDYNGEPAFAKATRENGALIVEGSKATRYVAPPNALAATHWNSAELRGPMINPQNGMLLTPKIACEGISPVTLASGASVSATKFAWRGQDALDLWYEPDGQWTALTAQTGDGSILTYERT